MTFARIFDSTVAIEVYPLDTVRRAVAQHLPRDDLRKVIAGVVVHVIVLVQRSHDVRRDVEIRAPIVVVVSPGGRRGVIAAEQVELGRNVAEAAVALIPIEQILSIAGDEQVRAARRG